MLDDRDALRAAVAEVITVDGADDALVATDAVEVLADASPVDDQVVAVHVRGGVDGVEQHGGGVVGVAPEGSRRRLTELGLVGREEVLGRHAGARVGVGAEAGVGTGQEHALRLLQLQEAIDQQAVSSQQHGVFETRHTRRLVGDEVASRLEDREEQCLRRTSSDLGQNRDHVGVFLGNSGEPGDRATQLLEGVRERRSQTVRVRVTIVDGSSRGQAELVEHELRHRSTLEQVVVRRAVVADVVVVASVALLIRRERRRGVRRRDHHHASLADQRSSSGGRTRAGGADDTDHLLISNDGLSRSLTTISRAQVVETRTRSDLETLDGSVVSNGHLDRTLVRHTEEGHIARDGVQRTDLDLIASSDRDLTK